MKKQKTQLLLSMAAIGLSGALLTQSYQTAEAKTDASVVSKDGTKTFVATREQRKTTYQVAKLLDRDHYLNQRLTPAVGKEILSMYFDRLDSNHTLLLQSDVDLFTKKYGDKYAAYLKHGDLRAGAQVFELYRKRSNEYFDYARELLTSGVDLHTDDTIILDREDLPRFTTKDEQKDYWRRQVTFQLMAITIEQQKEKEKEKVFKENPDITRGQDLIKDDQRSASQLLLQRLERRQGQINRIKDDEIMESILNTATLAYDPHSNYYAPIKATEMEVQSNLELEGIGVSIRPYRKNSDYTQIVTLVDAGPAEKSGKIKPNDLIVAIAKDGKKMQNVVGWSTREIVSLIRGKRGTEVVVKVKQPNTPDSSARVVKIVRDIIKQEESGVQHRVVNIDYKGEKKRIGVIEIPSFYLNFAAKRSGKEYRGVSIDTAKAVQALKKEDIDGLVIDLRNNPGGSLTEVKNMLEMFITEGPLVQIRDNRGYVQVLKDDDKGQKLYDGEMAVIINLASASASEIFAAAIQDYGRGLIVGSTTTGKGSAQSQLTGLEMGMSTLTQRKFYRINGGSTQNKGVEPDIELVNIYDNSDFGERSYKNPLKWDTIPTTSYKLEGRFTSDTLETLTEKSQARQKSDPQFSYLSTLNEIARLQDEKKSISINIDKRSAYYTKIEQKRLEAENKRRIATGKKPYKNWTLYQADIDALYEERSRLKDNEKPPLPEDEAYVIETATLMLEAKDLKKNQAKNTK